MHTATNIGDRPRLRSTPPVGRRRTRPAVWIWVALLALVPPTPSLHAELEVEPSAVDRAVCRLVTRMMGQHHYNGREMDDEMSGMVFDSYFERLDFQKSYFLASDIAAFESYRTVLDDQMRYGDVGFAFKVYEIFLERVRERVDFVKQRLQEPFDFTVDEEWFRDRSEEPWCVDVQELDRLWEQKLKDQLLVYEIMAADKEGDGEDADQDESEDPPDEDQEEDQDLADPVTDPTDAEDGEGDGATAVDTWPHPEPEERVLRFYERYLKRMEENGNPEILEMFLSTMTRVYDPHSVYMAPDTEEDFEMDMSNSLEGIGAVLTTEDGYVKVSEIVPGGPAARDGRLKAGDRIIAVAQEGEEPVDVIDMSLRKVVGMIRGPKGEPVLLTVLSADQGIGGVPVIIDIVRDKVELTEKDARSEIRRIQVPDPTGAERSVDVLYVYLPSFYSDFAGRKNGDKDFKSSTKDVARLIDTAVAEEQIGGVVLDLRGNGGGSLDEAVALSGLFFDQGPVVQIREPGRVVQRDDPEPGTHYDGPLVVMIDRLSASASEIVAAALKDYGRAVLVGEGATHGKGTVQTIFDLDRAFRGASLFRDQPPGSLKLTIAKFYRVTGGSTQKRGVSPHIALSSFTDYMELGEEHLPHVMPWDQIDALDVSSEVDVSPLVPTVIERSAARLAADREYQALVAEIEAYGERRQRKTVSLNRERRLEERDVERALSERLDELMTRGRAYAEDEAAQSDDESRDFLLQEGLSVLADLIELETASQNAVPEPGAEVGARSPQAVTDPATVRDRAAE